MVLSSRTFCDSLIMKLKLPNWGSLCNPNLLMNSDYRSGIINQKGETSYTGLGTTVLTIDGWISYGINVGLNATSVKFINRDSSYHTIRQKFDKKLKSNEIYTAYMKVINLSGMAYINPKTDKTKLQKIINGDNLYTFVAGDASGANVQDNEFIIGLEAGAEVEIQFMKLEPGEHFTGMPPWNRAEELIKCMYLFEKKIINVMCSQFNATTCYASIPYSTPKIKIPSITGKCTWVGSNSGQGIGENKITKLEATNIQDEYVDIKVTHESANFGQYSRNVFVELYIDSYSY